MTSDEQITQAREHIRMTLTTLASLARLALSHEDYEEAVEATEQVIMGILQHVWQTPAPHPDHRAEEGSWHYVQPDQGQRHARLRQGHIQLRDNDGHFVGYIVRRPDGLWEGSLHKASLPPHDQ